MNEQFPQTTRPQEQPKKSGETFKELDRLLRKVSNDIAQEIEEKYGIKNLLGEDCTIKMQAYEALAPDIYKDDIAFVNDREREWSGIENVTVKDHKMAEYGLSPEASDEEFIRAFLLAQAKEKSRQLEMAMTILLHKAFGKKYIVVRSSKYDDYNGGVDNVLVDKETGAVICGFDEVRNNPRSHRKAEKEDKVLEKARCGGTELIYGLSISGDEMKLKSMSNLPLFFLSLDEDEYDELIGSLKYGDKKHAKLNEVERGYVEKIRASIAAQQKQLLEDGGVKRHPEIVENLHRVDGLLNFKVD